MCQFVRIRLELALSQAYLAQKSIFISQILKIPDIRFRITLKLSTQLRNLSTFVEGKNGLVMSDWDVIGPINSEQTQDPVDGDDTVADDFPGFGGGDYDDAKDFVDDSISNERQRGSTVTIPASFNNRLDNRGSDAESQGDEEYPYDIGAHSYTERKLHNMENDDFASIPKPKPYRGNRRGNHRKQFKRSDFSGEPSESNVISHELLEKFDELKYQSFHDTAVDQRASIGIGKSQEMNSLYYFWCYYLRTHFNQEMYDEFLRLSEEDIIGGSHYGIECFFRFCSYGLEMSWNPEVYQDFERKALDDYSKGSKYGLEKVKSFLINQKHDFPIPCSEEMNAVLANFPTLDSFKDPAPPPQRRVRKQKKPRGGGNMQVSTPQNASQTEQTIQSKSIPKPFFLQGKTQPPPQPASPNQSRGGRGGEHQHGSGERSRGRGSNRGGHGRGGCRPRQYDEPNNETNWGFGMRNQPSSAPLDSPMRRKW